MGRAQGDGGGPRTSLVEARRTVALDWDAFETGPPDQGPPGVDTSAAPGRRLGPCAQRVRGNPRSTADVEGSGQRVVTTLVRV